MENEDIKGVYCEPGKTAVVKTIKSTLRSLQDTVCGYVEVYYPFEDSCFLVNEEGKISGMFPNRAVYQNGEMLDIIFGPFFICGLGEEDFCSLSDEQIEHYLKLYRLPERFIAKDGKILAIPYDPDGPEGK